MRTCPQARRTRLALYVSATVALVGVVGPRTAFGLASAELYSTQPHFYGRFEARIRFAPGDGAVSSFFLWKEGSSDANAYWNELDMEKVGANCEMHTNAFYGKPAAQHTQTNAMSVNICAEYHTYAFEWTPTYISWQIDGKEFRKETGATATAFAQNATGGMTIHFNLWPGNSSFGGDISKTTLPIRQYISWVQYSAYDNGTFKPEPRQEFDGTSIPTGWAVGDWASPFNLSTHNPKNVGAVNGIAVLALTADNATGSLGTPPADPAAGGTPGTGGSVSTGGAGGGAAGSPSTGGNASTGGSTGAAGSPGTGGTPSSSGGAASVGGAVGAGGAASTGGVTSQAGTTGASNGGASAGSQGGGGNVTGGSVAPGNGGAVASGGNSTTTTVPNAGSGGTSDTGGSTSKSGSSGGCSMTSSEQGAGAATWGLVLGTFALFAFRRARRRSSEGRRPGVAAWLGIFAALLVAWARPAEAKPYKGAEVYLLKGVLHGRVEVRMRMIRGSGLVSTFFTYKDGSEKSGNTWEEIDVEVLGKNDAKTWQSNLITGNPRQRSEQTYTVSTSLADDYHTYTVEWTPTYVSWYLDGTMVRKTEGGQASELVNPETLRFNAWSSDVIDWVGELDEGALPAYQYVNWIKYYRYENGEFTLDWTDDFDTFNTTRWGKGNWTFGGNRVDFDPANAVVSDGILVLAITKEGATGFSGTVPADTGTNTPGTITTNSHDDSGCTIASGSGERNRTLALGTMGLVAMLIGWRRARANRRS